jgi:hypothetical protein
MNMPAGIATHSVKTADNARVCMIAKSPNAITAVAPKLRRVAIHGKSQRK